MDTTAIRLGCQVLLVGWCAATAVVVLLSRGRMMHAAGHSWALLGLASFGLWMFLSALTIKDTELFPRSSVLWLFALVEVGSVVGAWGWLGVYARRNFHFHLRLRTVT